MTEAIMVPVGGENGAQLREMDKPEFVLVIGHRWGQVRDWLMDNGYKVNGSGQNCAYIYNVADWAKIKSLKRDTPMVVLDWPFDQDGSQIRDFINWCLIRFNPVNLSD